MIRKEKAIRDYLCEAEDRVSYIRKMIVLNNIANGNDPAPPGFDKDEWRKTRLSLIDQGLKKILSRGHIKNGDALCGYEYEYWEGVMAALRWVLGSDKDFLDT